MAGQLEVNIKTAKRAVGELEKTGILYSRKGKGTFVNQENLEPATILFVGRENKEISGVLSSILASSVDILELNYSAYSFMLPRRTGEGVYRLPPLRNLAGLLIEGGLLDHLDGLAPDLPVVQLHSAGNNELPVVRPDVVSGMTQVVDYLKSLGHQKIAYLGPELDRAEKLDCLKMESFSSQVKKQGLQENAEWNQSANFRVQAGYEAAMTVLSQENHPTAFACVNDEVALGVLNACDERGLSVPENISVVGFDDRSPAVMRKPFLTTVKVDFRQIAIEGIKLLHQCIQNPDATECAGREIVLPVHLVIRETTGICR
jgi:hypothetical protein